MEIRADESEVSRGSGIHIVFYILRLLETSVPNSKEDMDLL